MKLVVGLGNIGPQYARTRHNLGFMITSYLAHHLEGKWSQESRFMANVAEVHVGAERVMIAQPLTMMNLSGEAIRRLMDFYKLSPADVWVVFDDVDVPFGRLRLRAGGGSSGHQGVNSTIKHIGPDFVRVRAGISLNDRRKESSEVYVLKPFTSDEQAQLPRVIEKAAEVIWQQLTRDEPEETTFSLL